MRSFLDGKYHPVSFSLMSMISFTNGDGVKNGNLETMLLSAVEAFSLISRISDNIIMEFAMNLAQSSSFLVVRINLSKAFIAKS